MLDDEHMFEPVARGLEPPERRESRSVPIPRTFTGNEVLLREMLRQPPPTRGYSLDEIEEATGHRYRIPIILGIARNGGIDFMAGVVSAVIIVFIFWSLRP